MWDCCMRLHIDDEGGFDGVVGDDGRDCSDDELRSESFFDSFSLCFSGSMFIFEARTQFYTER